MNVVVIRALIASFTVQERQLWVVNVMMLSTMDHLVLHLMEELIEFVLNLSLESMTIMMGNIMVVVTIVLIEVTFEGMIRSVVISVGTVVRVCVALPIVGVMLDSMRIMMFSKVLGVMLALVLIRIIVTHVLGALRLNVVVLAVVFSSEVARIGNGWLVTSKVPVSLVKVSPWVVFRTREHDLIMMKFLGVRVLVGCHVTFVEVQCEVGLDSLLRLQIFLYLLLDVVRMDLLVLVRVFVNFLNLVLGLLYQIMMSSIVMELLPLLESHSTLTFVTGLMLIMAMGGGMGSGMSCRMGVMMGSWMCGRMCGRMSGRMGSMMSGRMVTWLLV